ncbi:hypothetical protein HYH03_005355 [Edaphochlamys debaryana]|uniref:Protein kinase domain-containing protein n=1 Tax=Edaphochlamys debaryana TaxID=47281 RepID=A0A835Y5S4_9CHLO|nr:hypothetical protein HYH03_005355 [Edaphochlamys debaryana]|eukprot:KAG2496531.1 hypothetical protein HYH03_005355 [Edaphochlamys debaryana]
MVFEFVGPSLHDQLDLQPTGLAPAATKLLAWQLLSGVAYLHDKKVLHRDIKPANVLLDPATGVAKLCDFGFARPTKCGPQVLVSDHYGAGADVWSLGCTIAEMATGRALFPGTSTADQLWRIVTCLGPLAPLQAARALVIPSLSVFATSPPPLRKTLRQRLPELEPRLFELVEACLRLDPRHRPTVRELLAMPYFWDVRGAAEGTPVAALIDAGQIDDSAAFRTSETAATATPQVAALAPAGPLTAQAVQDSQPQAGPATNADAISVVRDSPTPSPAPAALRAHAGAAAEAEAPPLKQQAWAASAPINATLSAPVAPRRQPPLAAPATLVVPPSVPIAPDGSAVAAGGAAAAVCSGVLPLGTPSPEASHEGSSGLLGPRALAQVLASNYNGGPSSASPTGGRPNAAALALQLQLQLQQYRYASSSCDASACTAACTAPYTASSYNSASPSTVLTFADAALQAALQRQDTAGSAAGSFSAGAGGNKRSASSSSAKWQYLLRRMGSSTLGGAEGWPEVPTPKGAPPLAYDPNCGPPPHVRPGASSHAVSVSTARSQSTSGAAAMPTAPAALLRPHTAQASKPQPPSHSARLAGQIRRAASTLGAVTATAVTAPGAERVQRAVNVRPHGGVVSRALMQRFGTRLSAPSAEPGGGHGGGVVSGVWCSEELPPPLAYSDDGPAGSVMLPYMSLPLPLTFAASQRLSNPGAPPKFRVPACVPSVLEEDGEGEGRTNETELSAGGGVGAPGSGPHGPGPVLRPSGVSVPKPREAQRPLPLAAAVLGPTRAGVARPGGDAGVGGAGGQAMGAQEGIAPQPAAAKRPPAGPGSAACPAIELPAPAAVVSGSAAGGAAASMDLGAASSADTVKKDGSRAGAEGLAAAMGRCGEAGGLDSGPAPGCLGLGLIGSAAKMLRGLLRKPSVPAP